MQNKTPDFIIEQHTTILFGGIGFVRVSNRDFIPDSTTVAIFKVYVKPEEKEKMQNEFHYTY